MKLDWQHVTIIVAGLGFALAVIILGQGHLLLQLLAAAGGASGVAAWLKSSPLDPKPGTIVATPPVVEFSPEEAPTKKEGP